MSTRMAGPRGRNSSRVAGPTTPCRPSIAPAIPAVISGISSSGRRVSGAAARFRSEIAMAKPAISLATSVIARLRSLGLRLENGSRLRGRMFSVIDEIEAVLEALKSMSSGEPTGGVALFLAFADDWDLFVDNEVRRGRVGRDRDQKNEDVARAQAGFDLRLPNLADGHEFIDDRRLRICGPSRLGAESP